MRVEEGRWEGGTCWWRQSWSLTGIPAESVDIREGVTLSISTGNIVSGDTEGGKSNNG